MTMKVPRGLTLIELAIALAVLAILAAVAVPSMGARLDRQRAQGAAEGLAADLAEARFEAARRGIAVYVQTAEGADGNAWCWSVATAPGCGCGLPTTNACQLHATRSADFQGVRLVGGLAVQMEPAGTPLASQAVALETRRGERLRVDISALGRPRICAEKGTWPGLPGC